MQMLSKCVHHLLPNSDLQALHQLLLFQAMKVLVEVFLPPGGVRHKVVVLVQENHRLLSYTEEYNLLLAKAQHDRHQIIAFQSKWLLPSTNYTTSKSNWKQSVVI